MTSNREQTATRITQCALDLAEERGLDGFTMDDLAKCAGVSRRTLFNYVEGKMDAVLGAPTAPDPERLKEFRAGGPTGRMSTDIKGVITALLDSKNFKPDELDRLHRLIASDARLHKALHDKFARFADFLAVALQERGNGQLSELQARAAATATLSLFDISLKAFVDDPTTSLADHFVAAFDGATAIFA